MGRENTDPSQWELKYTGAWMISLLHPEQEDGIPGFSTLALGIYIAHYFIYTFMSRVFL